MCTASVYKIKRLSWKVISFAIKLIYSSFVWWHENMEHIWQGQVRKKLSSSETVKVKDGVKRLVVYCMMRWGASCMWATDYEICQQLRQQQVTDHSNIYVWRGGCLRYEPTTVHFTVNGGKHSCTDNPNKVIFFTASKACERKITWACDLLQIETKKNCLQLLFLFAIVANREDFV